VSTNTPPRYELPIADNKGRISREWYKYLVALGISTDNSGTSADDLQNTANTDVAQAESLALTARKLAQDAAGLFLLAVPEDRKQVDDTSLLSWWPGDSK
jgi:hypothetical protein